MSGNLPVAPIPRQNGKRPRLSRMQARVLLLLAERERRSIRRIAELLGAGFSSVQHTTLLLRERDWIARDVDGWSITAVGRDALPVVRAWLTLRTTVESEMGVSGVDESAPAGGEAAEGINAG